METNLTIAICTYNQTELLEECLNSLALQWREEARFNVFVIDNNSLETERRKTKALSSTFLFVTYELEPKLGLSHARNAAIALCKTEWLGFIDDDSKIGDEFIDRALKHIVTDKYEIFGGHIQSDWKFGKPKWLKQEFGSKPLLSNTTVLLDDDYLWGGNMFFKLSALKASQGFDPHAGMFGNKRGYSAENLIQRNLRSEGNRIAYDPELIVHHAVVREKLQWYWHIKWAYLTARDGYRIFPEQFTWNVIIITSLRSAIAPLKAMLCFISLDEYYWQNMLIESLSPLAVFLGKFRSKIKD